MDYAAAPPHAAVAQRLSVGAPCQTNLLGVKGVGELGTIGAVPSVVHAVLDALAERGVKHIEMPCTAEKVWRALGTRA
jgi:carbon-monoxide dehydrogenase large subunit